MLEPAWIGRHAKEFDVFHVHFGFDALTPEALQEIVDALRSLGKPLVYTVHDLTNPHHDTTAAHDAHLDVLIPGADALLTLTPGAADEVERRWGRRPIVVPHPHIVEQHELAEALAEPAGDRTGDRAGRAGPEAKFHVGVHAKSLRASMDPLPVVEALVELAERDAGLVVHVNGHRDILEPGGAKFEPVLAARLQDLAEAGRIELSIHDYLSDAQLWRYLAALDASVLPYRFGTHSGWLEACLDLGTAVIAPNVGYYADQGPVFCYERDATGGLDAASLQAALQAARRSPPVRHSPEWRAAQRAEIAAVHAEVYASVLTPERVAR